MSCTSTCTFPHLMNLGFKIHSHPTHALTLSWHLHVIAVSSASHTTVSPCGRAMFLKLLCSMKINISFGFGWFFTIVLHLHQTMKVSCKLHSRMHLLSLLLSCAGPDLPNLFSSQHYFCHSSSLSLPSVKQRSKSVYSLLERRAMTCSTSRTVPSE